MNPAHSAVSTATARTSRPGGTMVSPPSTDLSVLGSSRGAVTAPEKRYSKRLRRRSVPP